MSLRIDEDWCGERYGQMLALAVEDSNCPNPSGHWSGTWKPYPESYKSRCQQAALAGVRAFWALAPEDRMNDFVAAETIARALHDADAPGCCSELFTAEDISIGCGDSARHLLKPLAEADALLSRGEWPPGLRDEDYCVACADFRTRAHPSTARWLGIAMHVRPARVVDPYLLLHSARSMWREANGL